MAIPTSVSAHIDRDEQLWNEELARVRARRGTMTPAAAAAVKAVLRSILSEQARGDTRVFCTLAALER
jgi:hypothetical protein